MSQVQVFQTSTGDLERGLGYQHVVQEIGSNVEDGCWPSGGFSLNHDSKKGSQYTSRIFLERTIECQQPLIITLHQKINLFECLIWLI